MSLKYLISRINKFKNPGVAFEKVACTYLVSHSHLLGVSHIEDIDEVTRRKLLLPERDSGIDAVGLTEEGWIAIQCKFRSKQNSTISWKNFSTFDSLYHRTGPWAGKILITTANRVSHPGLLLRDEKFITGKALSCVQKEMWDTLISISEVESCA